MSSLSFLLTQVACVPEKWDVFDCAGQTPQRREFSYPRTLTKTEVHEELRRQFQDNYMPGPDPFPLQLTPLNPDEEAAAVASDSMSSSTSGVASNAGSNNSSMQVCGLELCSVWLCSH